MKKLLILIALAFTTLGYPQAEFEKIAITENTASSSTNRINTQEANGEVNYIDAVNLPVSTATTNALELETTVSAGAVSGFALTNNGDGTVNIGDGIAYLRSTNDPYATIIKYPISAVTNLALTDNANNYVLVDYNGGSPTITVTTNGSTINTQTNSLAYVIARVGNDLEYLNLVGQNVDPNAKLRIRFLNQEGIRRASGAVLGFSSRNLTLTSSVLFSGLIRINAAAFNTASPDTFTLAYNNGATWTRTTGQTQINNTQYNNSGTLTTMPNNTFRTDYVYLLPNNPSKLYVIMGTTTYNSLTLAKAAPRPSILPVELQAIGLEVGRLFIEKNSTTIAEVQSSFSNDFIGAPVPEHNSLTGLQGGTSGEYNHLTDAQVALVDGSEQTANKQNSLATDGTGVKFPTVDAVNLELINPYTLSDNPSELFLMSDFQTNSQKLYMQASLDGKSFFSLTNKETSFISSSGVDNVRDPSIMKYNGSYYAIYTAGVMGYVQYYKIAISSDGINWTDHSELSTSSVSPAVSWAPEWFVDSNGDVYVYFILALTDPLLGGNLVIYYSKANNIGLTSFTNPTILPISGVSSPALDPYVIKKGSTYYLFYAREDVAFNGYVEVATSTSPITGFTVIKDENDLGFGGGFEAPNIVEYSTGLYRMYIDKYSDGSGKYYSESTDLLTWSTPVAISSNYISRHGTVIKSTDVNEIKFFLKQAFYNSAINGSNYSGLILNSPYITGAPVAPTASLSDNSTKLATTAFVQQELNTLTFQEVTTAGNTTTNDITSKSSTIINGAAGTKFRANNSGGGYFEAGVNSNATSDTYINFTNSLSISGGDVTFSNPVFAPTAAAGTNTTQIATTAYVDNVLTSGTHTATITNQTNCSGTSQSSYTYTKIGNIVTCRFSGSTSPTATSTATYFDITIPYSRATSSGTRFGSGTWQTPSTGEIGEVAVWGVSTTTVRIWFKSNSLNSPNVVGQFQYSVIE